MTVPWATSDMFFFLFSSSSSSSNEKIEVVAVVEEDDKTKEDLLLYFSERFVAVGANSFIYFCGFIVSAFSLIEDG